MGEADSVTNVDTDWAAIAAVTFAVTAFSLSQGLSYPLISLILTQQHVPASLIGFNGTFFAFGVAASTILVGPLNSLVRGDWLLTVALAGVSASLAVFAVFHSLSAWCVARFFLGFCESLIFIISEAWISTACPDHIRGRVSGIFGAGMCIGFAAGPLGIPLFGLDSNSAFALLAAYVAFVAFVTTVISRRARTVPEAAKAGLFLKFVGAAPAIIIIVLLFGLADIAAISGFPVYFAELGYSPSFAAITVTMVALPTALTQPAFGYLLDRFERTRVALLSAGVVAMTFICLPFLGTELAIFIDLAIAGAAIFGLYTAALTLLGSQFSGDMLIAGSAAFALAYSIGSAAGTAIFGVALEWISPAAGPIIVGVIVLVFAVGLWLARRSA